jgi:hypothetical protein
MAAIEYPRPRTLRVSGGNWLNPWVVGGLLLLGGAATLPVLQNSTTTTRGFDTERIEAQQTELRNQINLLEADVARLSSLDRISDRARQIGLTTPDEDPIYVTIDVPGPEPARIPSQYETQPAVTPTAPDSWWKSLLSWLPLGG